jgi:hypothetical protein
MSDFKEEDLHLTATVDDRHSYDSGYADVGPVRGGSALKAIFNPANKMRLVFMGIAAAFLVVVLFSVTVGFDEPEQGNRSLSASQTGRVNINGSIEGDSNSLIQQEERRRYNEDVLPTIQETDPTAHPLLNAEVNDYRVEEVDVNPFPVEEEGKPRNVSEALGVESSERPQRSRQQTDYRSVDSLIQGLIEQEGEGRRPQLSAVSWTYEVADQATPSSGAGFSQPVQNTQAANESAADSCKPYLARAGNMVMATTDLALNSDVQGPVSVTIRSGRLRGAQLIGAFERAETWLRINLTKMVFEDETKAISAIALDTQTTLNAVEGQVDRHLLYRYGWWGVGTTLKAIGKAAEMNVDSETYVSDGTVIQDTTSDSSREAKIMLGQLGQDMGDVFQDRLSRPITVSLRVGDEVGVFFMDDVCSATN